jgi:pyruvate ferredoxin oxidoreductase gamma subunit
MVFEIRIHGRGGQGVVTAAELISVAAFLEGRHAQAFPSFGPERTGAPIVAFCRIDDRVIRTREPIAQPDFVIVADPTLLHQPELFAGLKPDGLVLINSSRPVDELMGGYGIEASRVFTIAATELALTHTGKPLPNAVLLGGLAALSPQVELEAVVRAIEERFNAKVAPGNVAAARQACQAVQAQMSEPLHA